jgi:hypothetical protein
VSRRCAAADRELAAEVALAWQQGQIMIVVEAKVSRNRTLVSALLKKKTFSVGGFRPRRLLRWRDGSEADSQQDCRSDEKNDQRNTKGHGDRDPGD